MSKKSKGLFDGQVARKPDLYPWTKEFIDSMWSSFWTPNEFNFKADYSQFKSEEMTDVEREIIVKTLSAIGQIEIAVKTFWAKLGENLPHPSISDLGYVMANSEVIHNRAYEKLLDVLNLGDVFAENLKEPVVAKRVKYLKKYLEQVYPDQRQQYIYAITLFTLFIENVSLFSQFYIILWFSRYRNLLKDTSQQVQYTRQEETLHAQVGIKIINTLREEYPELFTDELKDRIINECKEAFKAESAIIDWIMGDYDQPYLDAKILKEFIKKRLNESIISIGFEPQFDIDTDLIEKSKWMDEALLGNSKTDFFFKKPIDYAKNNKSYNEEDLF